MFGLKTIYKIQLIIKKKVYVENILGITLLKQK